MKGWISDFLSGGLSVWNLAQEKITELVSMTPGGLSSATWTAIATVHGGLIAVANSLLILFFIVGVVRTCGSFTELKRPELTIKLFVRLILAKAAIDYSWRILEGIIDISTGLINTVSGVSSFTSAVIPEEITDTINDLGFFSQIGALLLSFVVFLVVVVLSVMIVITIYGRFFKIYILAAIAPLAWSTFGGESTQFTGKNFIKMFTVACMQGLVVILACLIFSKIVSSGNIFLITGEDSTAFIIIFSYFLNLIFEMLLLLGIVKSSDTLLTQIIQF